jgi:hypothetical protein
MKSPTLILAAAALLIAAQGALAEPVVIKVGDKLPRANLLKPGIHRYVRYTITPDGHRNAIDIWSREISFENKDGRRLMHIHQQWDEISHPGVLIQDAWFEPDTLRPLTQVKVLTRDGKTTIGGYRFLPDKIVGMDDLPGNSRKGFVQASPEPTNNWETDMEYLQALPLAQGYAASIDFYDPGLDPPARYIYTVTGSEKIPEPDSNAIDCWIVSIDFKDPRGTVTTHFWFAKKTQVLVREEAKLPDGSTLVKSLLTAEA